MIMRAKKKRNNERNSIYYMYYIHGAITTVHIWGSVRVYNIQRISRTHQILTHGNIAMIWNSRTKLFGIIVFSMFSCIIITNQVAAEKLWSKYYYMHTVNLNRSFIKQPALCLHISLSLFSSFLFLCRSLSCKTTTTWL